MGPLLTTAPNAIAQQAGSSAHLSRSPDATFCWPVLSDPGEAWIVLVLLSEYN